MPKRTLSLLLAYPYFKKSCIDYLRSQPHENYRLMVDSGAFTAWNLGKPISLDEYCTFLDSIECLRPFRAIQLDVIGDPEASYKNYELMRARGYDVMPVFTRGESLARLDDFFKSTDYILLGGVAFGQGNKEYVKWFASRTRGKKVHWLGFTRLDFIKHFKPTSCDSSSWAGAARFGQVEFYEGRGELTRIAKKDFMRKPSDELIRLMRRMKLNDREIGWLGSNEAWINSSHVPDLSENSKNIRTFAQLCSTTAHVWRSMDVEQNLGTHIYLAAGDDKQLKLMFAARNWVLERGILNE